jgi:hypothetical protein
MPLSRETEKQTSYVKFVGSPPLALRLRSQEQQFTPHVRNTRFSSVLHTSQCTHAHVLQTLYLSSFHVARRDKLHHARLHRRILEPFDVESVRAHEHMACYVKCCRVHTSHHTRHSRRYDGDCKHQHELETHPLALLGLREEIESMRAYTDNIRTQ